MNNLCLCSFPQHNYYFLCASSTTTFKKVLHLLMSQSSNQVSSSAKDTFDLPSSPPAAHPCSTLLSTHIIHPNICSVITCAETLPYIPQSEELWDASQRFLLCVTRAGGCHYTNAALLSNKGSATKKKNLQTAEDTDLQIIHCPILQPDMSLLFFLNVQLLIIKPLKQQDFFML